MRITSSLRAKMLTTVEAMQKKELIFMEVKGAEGFFVTVDESHENAIFLGAEDIDGKKYFLCQFDE